MGWKLKKLRYLQKRIHSLDGKLQTGWRTVTTFPKSYPYQILVKNKYFFRITKAFRQIFLQILHEFASIELFNFPFHFCSSCMFVNNFMFTVDYFV